LLLLDSTNIF